MFGNTLTITVDAGSVVLVRVNQDNYSSEYRKRDSTGEYRIFIRHTTTKATATAPAQDRHNVEFSYTLFATPTTLEQTRKSYVVIQQDAGDVEDNLTLALSAWLAASSGANIASLLAWES